MSWINSAQFERDHNGQRNTCSACGTTASEANPLVLSDDGFRIHEAHTRDTDSGFYGAQQGARARTQADGRIRDINLARTCAVYEDEGYNLADPSVRDSGLRHHANEDVA